MLEGFGNLFRYCGPHDDDAHPDHKAFHHKHTYDVLACDVVGKVYEVDPEEWPTLAEVITEACGWYYERADEIQKPRSSTKEGSREDLIIVEADGAGGSLHGPVLQ